MELMNSKEVCEFLNIKPNYLHQLQFRKKLNWSEKKGRNVYYSREVVESLGQSLKK